MLVKAKLWIEGFPIICNHKSAKGRPSRSVKFFQMSKFGQVVSQHCCTVQGYPHIQNRICNVRGLIDQPIPSFLRFGRFQFRVQYEGQAKTCRRCNEPGHLAQECCQVLCFHCEKVGHHSRDCKEVAIVYL